MEKQKYKKKRVFDPTYDFEKAFKGDLPRENLIRLVESFNGDYAITLSVHNWVPMKIADARLREYVKRMNLALFKKSDRKLKDEEKLMWQHFYEVASGNSHYHSVVKFPPGTPEDIKRQFKIKSRQVWRKLARTAQWQQMAETRQIKNIKEEGQVWIDSDIDIRVAVYITKDGNLVSSV